MAPLVVLNFTVIKAFLSTLKTQWVLKRSTLLSWLKEEISESIYVKIQELLAEVTRVSTFVTKMTNPPAAAALAQSNPSSYTV